MKRRVSTLGIAIGLGLYALYRITGLWDRIRGVPAQRGEWP